MSGNFTWINQQLRPFYSLLFFNLDTFCASDVQFSSCPHRVAIDTKMVKRQRSQPPRQKETFSSTLI